MASIELSLLEPSKPQNRLFGPLCAYSGKSRRRSGASNISERGYTTVRVPARILILHLGPVEGDVLISRSE
jgi:hypothetical protein